MSAEPERALEVHEDLTFQRWSWRVQRAGWVLMSLIMLAAIGGAFGPGLFGERSLETPSGFRLAYDRFIRFEAPASFQLDLPARKAAHAEFWVERGWLDRVHVENVDPEPERVVAHGERVYFSIAAEPGEAVRVIFHFEADTVGSLRGAVGEPGEAGLAIEQFAYP